MTKAGVSNDAQISLTSEVTSCQIYTSKWVCGLSWHILCTNTYVQCEIILKNKSYVGCIGQSNITMQQIEIFQLTYHIILKNWNILPSSFLKSKLHSCSFHIKLYVLVVSYFYLYCHSLKTLQGVFSEKKLTHLLPELGKCSQILDLFTLFCFFGPDTSAHTIPLIFKGHQSTHTRTFRSCSLLALSAALPALLSHHAPVCAIH